MRFLIRLLVTALSIMLVAYVLPGIEVDSFMTALFGAFFLGVLNAVVRPVLILLTLPITIVSLGLFILVINASLVLLTSHFVPGFSVAGFWSALFASVLISIVSSIANREIA